MGRAVVGGEKTRSTDGVLIVAIRALIASTLGRVARVSIVALVNLSPGAVLSDSTSTAKGDLLSV